MVDGYGHPLPGVLVSLSGANFRSNNFSKEDGRIKYNKLVRDTNKLFMFNYNVERFNLHSNDDVRMPSGSLCLDAAYVAWLTVQYDSVVSTAIAES